MSAYTTRPLSDRSWVRPNRDRTTSRFGSTWTQTLELLTREVDHLDGRYLVIGVDVEERDLRLDGTLRARAQAATPAVEVAFDSKHGPMLYRCDRFTIPTWRGSPGLGWQENVRAIALTLEALRAVDRYGASSSGEQYRGYQQLTAFPAPGDPLDVDAARARLRDIAYAGLSELLPQRVPDERLINRARRAAHPDRGGSSELWAEVDQLAQILAGQQP